MRVSLLRGRQLLGALAAWINQQQCNASTISRKNASVPASPRGERQSRFRRDDSLNVDVGEEDPEAHRRALAPDVEPNSAPYAYLTSN
jgi:hypothetical protein